MESVHVEGTLAPAHVANRFRALAAPRTVGSAGTSAAIRTRRETIAAEAVLTLGGIASGNRMRPAATAAAARASEGASGTDEVTATGTANCQLRSRALTR